MGLVSQCSPLHKGHGKTSRQWQFILRKDERKEAASREMAALCVIPDATRHVCVIPSAARDLLLLFSALQPNSRSLATLRDDTYKHVDMKREYARALWKSSATARDLAGRPGLEPG